LELVEEAGHALPQERPEEVGLAIGRFLRESEASGPTAGLAPRT
jgi:hypothetical protein